MRLFENYLSRKDRHVVRLNELYSLGDINWDVKIDADEDSEALKQFTRDLTEYLKRWLKKNCKIDRQEYINDE